MTPDQIEALRRSATMPGAGPLVAVVRELIAGLPRCVECGNAPVARYVGGQQHYCATHTEPGDVPLPYAPALRALVEVLGDGGEP